MYDMYTPNKSIYFNPNIEYLFNEDIIEYDMGDAGFSLIKEYKLLPEDEINRLQKIPKGKERHIAIGKIQRGNKEFANSLTKAFIDARELFIEYNKLDDNRIISVKKDAFFIIDGCKRNRFGYIQFKKKNIYSSYIRFSNIHNLEVYYSNTNLDIKGMNEKSIDRHRLYLYDFLRKIISMIEIKNERVKRYIMNFIEKYKKGELDEGYYLEFNNKSVDINPIFNYLNIIIPLVMIINKVLK